MALSSVATFVRTPKLILSQILNADGTAKKDIATGGADGTKIVGLQVASNDSVLRYAQFSLLKSGSGIIYNLTAVAVPIASGTDIAAGLVPPVSVFQLCPGLPSDYDGQKYLFLENGDKLQWNLGTAATAAKQFDATAVAANF